MSAARLTASLHRGVLSERTVVVAVAAAWALALWAELSGSAGAVHHHQVAGEFTAGRLVLFAGAWTAMVVAMMLPATLPLIRLFFRASASQERPGLAKASFLSGYLVVWLLFGIVALGSDIGIHALVDAWGALSSRPWLLPGGSLLAAGLFQFSDLKQKCLTECRHPAAFLMRHYRRGAGPSFSMGAGHGVFCVGCCWALMFLMFAMGVANLVWMAGLTAVMIVEKALPGGDRMVKVFGAGLAALAILVLIQPTWLPAALQYGPESPAHHPPAHVH